MATTLWPATPGSSIACALILVAIMAVGVGFGDLSPLVGALALVAGVVAAVLGYALGALASRDARKGWVLARGGAIGALVALAVLAQIGDGRAFLAVPAPLISGYLLRRGSDHASDVALSGAFASLAIGVSLHAHDWDGSGWFLVPCALGALALATREAWDLLNLRARARAQRVEGGRAAPWRARAELVALAWAVIAMGAAVTVGAALGLTRNGWAASVAQWAGIGLASFLLVLALWGAWMLLGRSRPIP